MINIHLKDVMIVTKPRSTILQAIFCRPSKCYFLQAASNGVSILPEIYANFSRQLYAFIYKYHILFHMQFEEAFK